MNPTCSRRNEDACPALTSPARRTVDQVVANLRFGNRESDAAMAPSSHRMWHLGPSEVRPPGATTPCEGDRVRALDLIGDAVDGAR